MKDNQYKDLKAKLRECEGQLFTYENKVADILERFTDAFFEVDDNVTITYWNKEAERLLMMPRNLVVGKNLWEVYKEAVPLKFYSEYNIALEKKVARRFEEYFPPLDKWFEVAAFPSGKGLSVYFKDITERKIATSLLQQEKRRYADLFNLSPAPQLVYDEDTLCFLDINEAAIHYYQYSREEFLGMTIRELSLVGEIEVQDESIVCHRKKDGTLIYVRMEGNVINFEERDARLVMVLDRTREVEARRALEKNEQRFKALVQHGSDMIGVLDTEGNYLYVSPTTKAILGIDEASFIGKNAFDYIHPDDKVRTAKQFGQLQHRKQLALQPFRFKDHRGVYRWMETILTNMTDDPALKGIVSNSRDITRRIENERKTEESIKRFNIVSKATSDAIWDWDMFTGEMSWNQGIKSLFGHPRVVYTEQWWRDHVHPDDVEEVRKKFASMVKRKKKRLKVQYRFKGADGNYRFVLDRSFTIFNAEGVPKRMIGSMQDITDQIKHIKAIEEQNAVLQEISWIQSHKIRGPLASILGLVSLMKGKVGRDEIKEIIPNLKNAAEELDQVLKEIVRKAT